MKTLSLDAFIAELARVQRDIPIAQEEGLKAAAGLIQREAKRELGTYQRDNMGPFLPWEDLADVTKATREEQGFAPNDPLERERILEEHIMASADGRRAAVGVPNLTIEHTYDHETTDIGQIAIDLEFGTSHIPPRSFLGSAGFRMSHKAAHLIASYVAWTLASMPNRRRAPPATEAGDPAP